MAKFNWALGATDRTILVFLQDDTASDGSGKTGLVAADLTCYFARVETDNDVTVTQLSLSDLASITAAHSDGGIKEVDATNMPGVYRLDLSDAVLASGAWSVTVMVKGSAIAPVNAEIQLVSDNPETSLFTTLWTTALTEAYNADGAAPTPAQALFMILQYLTEKAVSGTTLTVKKLDGSTTAATFTLSDATSPTSITRAS